MQLTRKGFFQLIAAAFAARKIPLAPKPAQLLARDYYTIEWPVKSRERTFITYAHEVLQSGSPRDVVLLENISSPIPTSPRFSPGANAFLENLKALPRHGLSPLDIVNESLAIERIEELNGPPYQGSLAGVSILDGCLPVTMNDERPFDHDPAMAEGSAHPKQHDICFLWRSGKLRCKLG
jgi:hypothetical protein